MYEEALTNVLLLVTYSKEPSSERNQAIPTATTKRDDIIIIAVEHDTPRLDLEIFDGDPPPLERSIFLLLQICFMSIALICKKILMDKKRKKKERR